MEKTKTFYATTLKVEKNGSITYERVVTNPAKKIKNNIEYMAIFQTNYNSSFLDPEKEKINLEAYSTLNTLYKGINPYTDAELEIIEKAKQKADRKENYNIRKYKESNSFRSLNKKQKKEILDKIKAYKNTKKEYRKKEKQLEKARKNGYITDLFITYNKLKELQSNTRSTDFEISFNAKKQWKKVCDYTKLKIYLNDKSCYDSLLWHEIVEEYKQKQKAATTVQEFINEKINTESVINVLLLDRYNTTAKDIIQSTANAEKEKKEKELLYSRLFPERAKVVNQENNSADFSSVDPEITNYYHYLERLYFNSFDPLVFYSLCCSIALMKVKGYIDKSKYKKTKKKKNNTVKIVNDNGKKIAIDITDDNGFDKKMVQMRYDIINIKNYINSIYSVFYQNNNMIENFISTDVDSYDGLSLVNQVALFILELYKEGRTFENNENIVYRKLDTYISKCSGMHKHKNEKLLTDQRVATKNTITYKRTKKTPIYQNIDYIKTPIYQNIDYIKKNGKTMIQKKDIVYKTTVCKKDIIYHVKEYTLHEKIEPEIKTTYTVQDKPFSDVSENTLRAAINTDYINRKVINKNNLKSGSKIDNFINIYTVDPLTISVVKYHISGISERNIADLLSISRGQVQYRYNTFIDTVKSNININLFNKMLETDFELKKDIEIKKA